MSLQEWPDFAKRFKQIMAMPGNIASDAHCYEGMGEGCGYLSEADLLKLNAFRKLDRDITRDMYRKAGLLK